MIIVEPEIQGQHSITPPEIELKHAVMVWLNSLFPDTVAEVNETMFTLKINCRRISHTNAVCDVKLLSITEFSPNCVELRVRPEGNTYAWPCVLVCPDADFALQLHKTVRPEAMAYSASFDTIVIETDKFRVLPARNRYQTNQAILDLQRQCVRAMKKLSKRETTRTLCHNLHLATPGNIPLNILHREIATVLGITQNIETILLKGFVLVLVMDGVLDPVGVNDVQQFRRTILFDEYVDEFEERDREQRRTALESQKNNLAKYLQSARTDHERKMFMLNNLALQIAEMERQIREIDEALS